MEFFESLNLCEIYKKSSSVMLPVIWIPGISVCSIFTSNLIS